MIPYFIYTCQITVNAYFLHVAAVSAISERHRGAHYFSASAERKSPINIDNSFVQFSILCRIPSENPFRCAS